MKSNEIVSALKYFCQFAYAPTFTELYMFLPKQQERDAVQGLLKKMVKNGKIQQLDCGDTTKRYTLGGYKIDSKDLKNRIQVSCEKKKRIEWYIAAVAHVPSVQLVGLSGSVAMNNAKVGDDIDIFVIARTNRMFTVRFWLVIAAFVMGQKRPKNAPKTHVANTICLNMFFDESNLHVPKYKQNQYGAHEVLQMKPLVDKNATHDRFLVANKWVYRFYPNAVGVEAESLDTKHLSNRLQKKLFLSPRLWLGDLLESVLKQLQMYKINRSKTTEIITNTQLWFFPDDFETKVVL